MSPDPPIMYLPFVLLRKAEVQAIGGLLPESRLRARLFETLEEAERMADRLNEIDRGGEGELGAIS